MSVYYCPECGSVYDGMFFKDFNRYGAPCPNLNCVGYCFEVDELMLEPIKILNEKGYLTKFCCSGHSYLDSCVGYIMFEDFIGDVDKIFKDLPEGWRFDGKDTIRYDLGRNMNGPERLLDIFKHIEALMIWVEELECYDEEDYIADESEC